MGIFRTLRTDEIECRVGQVFTGSSWQGVSLLLYKDARADMNILDECIGPDKWQREHYECKGNLYCKVGIKLGNEWVWKADCGTESNTEKEKGESSDSFKRACVNWGIGRELYTSPRIFISSNDCVLIAKGNGKYTCNDKFIVTDIAYENGSIVRLKIKNTKQGINRVVFSYGY